MRASARPWNSARSGGGRKRPNGRTQRFCGVFRNTLLRLGTKRDCLSRAEVRSERARALKLTRVTRLARESAALKRG